MEKILNIKTGFDTHNTKISVDNTTEFKDLTIVQERNTHTPNTLTESLSLQLHRGLDGKGEVTLEIGKFSLIGREVEILKEFLNQ